MNFNESEAMESFIASFQKEAVLQYRQDKFPSLYCSHFMESWQGRSENYFKNFQTPMRTALLFREKSCRWLPDLQNKGGERMAFFYMRTSIIKASTGKSAVASAAYMSAQALYNERLGQTFQYRNKEEVVFSEVLLPEYAPPEFKDREKLWNAVEAKENKCNSRYARQFIIALPKEWERDECIERTREFIAKSLTANGMCADWAFHNKENNPHVHIQCTVRGFNKDGSWAQMEKKVYAVDQDGNKIPEIDPATGEQKLRVRTRNGKTSTERLYKRVTVQTNDWNSKAFLREVKKAWAETCNKYLKEEQLDYRSYKERGLNRVPLIHESYGSRRAYKERDEIFDDVRENMERRAINQKLEQLEQFIKEARRILDELRQTLKRWRETNAKTRSLRTNQSAGRDGAADNRISGTASGCDARDDEFTERWRELENRSRSVRRRR